MLSAVSRHPSSNCSAPSASKQETQQMLSSILIIAEWRCAIMHKRLMTATFLSAVLLSSPAWAAAPVLRDAPVPPIGMDTDPAREILERANPANTPIAGASIVPDTVGGARPPSLEALMAVRPGVNPTSKLSASRAEELREAALTYGATGGLAARGFQINQSLRRMQAQLDAAFDFSALVVPVGSGSTLLRPPVVSEAQAAFALGEGGQTARETGRIYRITREGQLASEPPNWRSYLVQNWPDPSPPSDELRPRTDEEVEWWKKCVAEGWAKGEAQGTDIFLSQLGKLMARYRVLLRAGLVEGHRERSAGPGEHGHRACHPRHLPATQRHRSYLRRNRYWQDTPAGRHDTKPDRSTRLQRQDHRIRRSD
jgi:defect-in-organelle-trafficking protein DotC